MTWVSTLKKLALAGSGESIFTHSQTTRPDGPHTLEAWMGLESRELTEELNKYEYMAKGNDLINPILIYYSVDLK